MTSSSVAPKATIYCVISETSIVSVWHKRHVFVVSNFVTQVVTWDQKGTQRQVRKYWNMELASNRLRVEACWMKHLHLYVCHLSWKKSVEVQAVSIKLGFENHYCGCTAAQIRKKRLRFQGVKDLTALVITRMLTVCNLSILRNCFIRDQSLATKWLSIAMHTPSPRSRKG